MGIFSVISASDFARFFSRVAKEYTPSKRVRLSSCNKKIPLMTTHSSE